MDVLYNMKIFARVARLGGFTAAADELRLSNTIISRRVRQLEDHLGVQLLRRTTREVTLTKSGQVYLERCEHVLDEVVALEESVRERRRVARGVLRVSVGVDYGRLKVLPELPTLLDEHPELDVHVQLTDRHVDLLSEGIDVALRIGQLQDSSMIARRIAACEHRLMASPSLLSQLPPLDHPDQLDPKLLLVDTNQPKTLTLEREGDSAMLRPAGRTACNSAMATRDLAVAGLGVALLPDFVLDDERERGLLEDVLSAWRYPMLRVHAVYPPNRYLSASVRAFVDFMTDRLAVR